MKNRNIALNNFAIIILLISSFFACDKDFASLDSDIINNDNATHFITESMKFDVVTYNKKLDPVQTNNLPINLLGIYNDLLYGTTTGNVVTKISPSFYNPTFGENVLLDSVVLTIPYFSNKVEVIESGETIYDLDSVIGTTPIKLSIYENNYFLRDFDPNSEIGIQQKYYSDGSTGSDQISPAQLEGRLLLDITDFLPSEKEIILLDSVGEVSTRLTPSLRLKMDNAFWQEKIIDKEGEPELSNANNFNNYFRGIYFKAKAIGLDGNALMLNFNNTNANITMYYTRDTSADDDTRVSGNYSFSFRDKSVNFLSELNFQVPTGNETDGDEKLYLKGAQGSLAVIDLFNGTIQDPDSGLDISQLEYFKNKKGKWLINEANIIFYVDQASVEGIDEPDRIYLYNIERETPLIDYYRDAENSIAPINSRINHLGRLERVDGEADGKGIKYKMKITEHINNILLNDSTNVKLGLSVSANINLEGTNIQPAVLTTDELVNKVPISSILTPNGTVLFGNNTPIDEKKVYLEIYFTEPKNN
jgi:hypothetical protein